ncbi:uncharacterized protein EKO05_0000024 [Ascochyta rabiei]|uniref:Metal ion binding n=1 Tax=Didymella rabiei TaxID=5454 RepID=A0A163MD70_DIDRA|nr:uncharacterized protein EKO05_0000024 [Ascochyta rabiei]KZM28613.1 metal ion binding [Ascochyta rabiei]UPX09333.1 hypothetical protein EKO05_0000024 [Ascochyta rabiei]
MSPTLTHLAEFRLPDYPAASLTLNGKSLSIYDENSSLTNQEQEPSAVPTGIATILYRWSPAALAAFLDTDAWFSLTWTVALPENKACGESAKQLEIGRVGNQVTFGTLDASGDNFEIMCTFNIALASETAAGVERRRGEWVPNVRESMLGEADMKSGEEVEEVGARWVGDVLANKRWDAAKGVKHSFHVEYAPMDIFGDGIPMSPHWLYNALDLSKCTTCNTEGSAAKPLNRCGRCGTAAYCSSVCQKEDWRVHKWVCTMSMEDRGQAIKISEKSGLYKWDTARTMAAKGEEVASDNPFFETVQSRRTREE